MEPQDHAQNQHRPIRMNAGAISKAYPVVPAGRSDRATSCVRIFCRHARRLAGTWPRGDRPADCRAARDILDGDAENHPGASRRELASPRSLVGRPAKRRHCGSWSNARGQRRGKCSRISCPKSRSWSGVTGRRLKTGVDDLRCRSKADVAHFGELYAISLPLGLAALVFLPAGRIDWTAGWVFIAVLAAFGLSALLLARANPMIYRARS